MLDEAEHDSAYFIKIRSGTDLTKEFCPDGKLDSFQPLYKSLIVSKMEQLTHTWTNLHVGVCQ
jgi:hypothetical protein